jgi:3-methylcrotonyl-CoA carboxylase alpha subunit
MHYTMEPRTRQFRRLLIANRGEIAVRIARAARDESITPLGVYSEADRKAAFLDSMEEATLIGPSPATQSYLRMENILAAARLLHADAVHPGYGFLSERPAFAQAVSDAGLIFVGPPAKTMFAVGDKSQAKQHARACDIPVIPGYDGEDQTPIFLRAQATLIGTPVLVKASAGGGGRGMRVVDDLHSFDQALDEAKREALAGFGDDRVLLERYLARPRHIEFQILADTHGNIVHIGERECSIQRRHQKILEESPSPAMTPELRAHMGEAAVRIAQATGYVNAGTVEFLVDAAGAFYFLEMNARLQVEHPITEQTYGIDLVRAQLRIAAGFPLSLKQEKITPRAWAIEARINAEEPTYDALPASGVISEWTMPSNAYVRVDGGVRCGSEVSIHYDSLLAKLIVTAPDRADAIRYLTEALRTTYISGVTTNIPLLLKIVRSEDFHTGFATTAFLEEHRMFFSSSARDDAHVTNLLAIAAACTDPRTWRIAHVGIPIILERVSAGHEHPSVISVLASRIFAIDTWKLSGDVTTLITVHRNEQLVSIESPTLHATGRVNVMQAGIDVFYDGMHVYFNHVSAEERIKTCLHAEAPETNDIISPMPGKIGKISIRAGDIVHAHDLLLTLEAMKMEHRIEAPRSGTVRTVHVLPGALVTKGALLLELFSD